MLKQIGSITKPCLQLMRLDKPIGSLLLLWPTLWGLWIAAQGFPGWRILLIFVMGVLVMRSAGCVINDIADRHFDVQVSRTKHRPLASGKVNLKQAIGLFLLLCFFALLLVFQLNFKTIALSSIGLLLAIIYPFTKRVTHLPQLFLGAAFAWAIPMSFVAVGTSLSLVAWLLFLVASIWPIAYDTIYALMDKEEDIKIGIKSSAILFGNWDRIVIFLLQVIVIMGLFAIGMLINAKPIFYNSLMIALGLCIYQMGLIKARTVASYYRAFYNNNWVGMIIFLGLFMNFYS